MKNFLLPWLNRENESLQNLPNNPLKKLQQSSVFNNPNGGFLQKKAPMTPIPRMSTKPEETPPLSTPNKPRSPISTDPVMLGGQHSILQDKSQPPSFTDFENEKVIPDPLKNPTPVYGQNHPNLEMMREEQKIRKEKPRKFSTNKTMAAFMADVRKNDGEMTREMIEEYYPEFADNVDSALQLQAEIAPIVSKGEAVEIGEIKKYYPELFLPRKRNESSNTKREGSLRSLLRPQENKERNDNLFGKLTPTDEATTVGGVFKEFGTNALKSTVNLASDIGNMVANPWDTAKGFTQGVLGGVANAVGADDWLAERSDFWAGANETADAMGKALAERYGSREKLSHTAYTDPVGVFSDIMSVIAPVAGATRTGAKLGVKGAQAANLTKTAGKLAKVVDVVGDIAKVTDAVDPANILMKGAGKVAKLGTEKGLYLGLQMGKKGLQQAKKGFSATQESLRKLQLGDKTKSVISGLDKDTIKGIQKNPYVSEYRQEAKQIIHQDGAPQDFKELSRPQYEKVGAEVLQKINRAKEAFSESGPLYQKIREVNAQVDITPALEEIKNVLKKHQIRIEEGGALDFGYSSIVKNEDMHAISTLLDRVNGGLVNDANTVLNLRKVSDQLSKWDSGTTSEGMKVIREIRKAVDNVAKEQIPGLQELDKLYRSRIDDLNQIQEGIVYRQGDRRGQVRDNFNQIIKTIGGENRARMAERLSEIAPDLLERVSAIHGVEKLAKAYTNPPKLSKLVSPIGGALGLGFITNSWGGALGGAIAGYFGDKFFSKISKSHLNKIASQMSPEAMQKLEAINAKLAENSLLNDSDKALLKTIKEKIESGSKHLGLPYKEGVNHTATFIHGGRKIVAGKKGSYRAKSLEKQGMKHTNITETRKAKKTGNLEKSHYTTPDASNTSSVSLTEKKNKVTGTKVGSSGATARGGNSGRPTTDFSDLEKTKIKGEHFDLSHVKEEYQKNYDKIIRGEADNLEVGRIDGKVAYDGKERPAIFSQAIQRKIVGDHGLDKANLLATVNEPDYIIKNIDGKTDKINIIKKIEGTNNFVLIGADRQNRYFILSNYEVKSRNNKRLIKSLGRGDVVIDNVGDSSNLNPKNIVGLKHSPRETVDTLSTEIRLPKDWIFETLPEDVSVFDESKKLGPKRIAPDRKAHQQLDPQAAMEKLAEAEKKLRESKVENLQQDLEKYRSIMQKYDGKLPARTEKNRAKYPDLVREYGEVQQLKKQYLLAGEITKSQNIEQTIEGMIEFNKSKIESITPERMKERYIELVQQDISKGYKYPEAVLNFIPEVRKILNGRERYEKGLHTSFSAQDERINYDYQDTLGVGMKRQDGKELTLEQKQDIVEGVKDFEEALGLDMKKLGEEKQWVYVHLNGKNVFLKNGVGGLYREKGENISISVGGTETVRQTLGGGVSSIKVHTVMSHELGHALDAIQNWKLFPSSKLFDLKIRMNKAPDGNSRYWKSDAEITARAIEQYVGIKKGNTTYYEKPSYWKKDIYENIIEPMIKESIEKKFEGYMKSKGAETKYQLEEDIKKYKTPEEYIEAKRGEFIDLYEELADFKIEDEYLNEYRSIDEINDKIIEIEGERDFLDEDNRESSDYAGWGDSLEEVVESFNDDIANTEALKEYFFAEKQEALNSLLNKTPMSDGDKDAILGNFRSNGTARETAIYDYIHGDNSGYERIMENIDKARSRHMNTDYDEVRQGVKLNEREYSRFRGHFTEASNYENGGTLDDGLRRLWEEGNAKYQKHGVANPLEKNITAERATQLKNIRNGRSVQELADHYGINIETVEKIATPEGLKAYGKYGDGIITLAEKIKEGTAPHELFHGVFDIVDTTRKENILSEIGKRKGVNRLEAEEFLADSFSEYYRTGKMPAENIVGNVGRTLGAKLIAQIKAFYQQVKDWITGVSRNKKQVKQLFDDILDGEIEKGNIYLKTPDGKVYQQAGSIYSDNFKKWFGDWENDPKNASKVVNEEGEPLVVYRGTPEKLGYIFEGGKNYYGGHKGFWFTNQESVAKDYAIDVVSGEFGEVKSVYLDIKNPINLIPLGYRTSSKNFNKFIMDNYGIDLGRGSNKIYEVKQLYEKYQNELLYSNHDGIKLADKGTTWIAKYPIQIKSATNNIGTYDPSNPDIRYQLVYHGSPYEFEKFDSAHMGKGEGAQAHGWGHYVAVDKETGQTYANDLGLHRSTYKGILSRDLVGAQPEMIVASNIIAGLEKGKSFESIKKGLEKDYKKEIKYHRITKDDYLLKLNQSKLDYLLKMEETDFNINTRGRNLYEIEIPDPVKANTPTGKNYWEQQGKVKSRAVDAIVKQLKKGLSQEKIIELDELIDSWESGYDHSIEGGRMYRIIANTLGSDKKASKFLQSLGYDGIHYHGGRDGEAYVIFDDAKLEIKKHTKL